MSFAVYDRKYVATYKEIVLAFIVFSIILIVLYPKELLQNQILSEESNYDLSMLYLKNLLKNDPKNEFLMYSLAEQSLRSGKKDLSFRLLGLLLKSKDEDMRIKSYLLSYELAKEDYYYLKNKEKTVEANKKYLELQVFFNEIISQNIYDKNKLKELYAEAVFLEDTKNSYKIIKQLLYLDKSDIKLLEDAYYLSQKLNKFKDSLGFINTLVNVDKKNITQWNEAKYYLITNHYSPKETKKLLKSYAKDSLFWKKKLVAFYVYNKEYILASKSSMKLFQQSKFQEEKITLWKNAIIYLNYGKHTSMAVRLGYKYQNYFYKNKSVRMYLLKLYIAAGDLDKANNLSKEILKDKIND